MTHGVEGGVAGLGGGGGVCLRAGSGLRVSVFGGERETRRDFGVHYTPLVLVRDDLMRDLGSLTDNSVSCLRFSTSWLVYSLSLPVPCYALNFFQKPCSTTVSIEYSQWTGDTHGRSQVVLCVVGRHGLWLGRIGSISEEGGGADHGVWGSDWSAALCQSSVELSCGHLPAANHRAPISTATLRHYRGYAIYVNASAHGIVFFVTSTTELMIAGSICSWEFRLQPFCRFPSSRPSFPSESFPPADNGRLEPARKLYRCVLGPVGQLLPHSRDRGCLLPGP